MENLNSNAQKCNTQVFWGEVAPCDHVLQIYQTDDTFLDVLEEFVTCGINNNDCVIIIGTVNHLKSMEKRLQSKGLNMDALADDDQLILLNAEITLGRFMRNGKPDERLFNNLIMGLINRAKIKNRKVKAFGEMVAILWGEGHTEATILLETLWNKFCKAEGFCLFCAYPKSGFTEDMTASIHNICQTHTKVIDEWDKIGTEVVYQSVPPEGTQFKMAFS